MKKCSHKWQIYVVQGHYATSYDTTGDARDWHTRTVYIEPTEKATCTKCLKTN